MTATTNHRPRDARHYPADGPMPWDVDDDAHRAGRPSPLDENRAKHTPSAVERMRNRLKPRESQRLFTFCD